MGILHLIQTSRERDPGQWLVPVQITLAELIPIELMPIAILS
jgi:hypothetical protein